MIEWVSEGRTTWGEVAKLLPESCALTFFDRDVAPLLDDNPHVALFWRRIGAPYHNGVIDRVIDGVELWFIDEAAPVTAHRHEVRDVRLSFPETSPITACRCRVWRGDEEGWRPPSDEGHLQRGGLYMVSGGRERFVRASPSRPRR